MHCSNPGLRYGTPSAFDPNGVAQARVTEGEALVALPAAFPSSVCFRRSGLDLCGFFPADRRKDGTCSRSLRRNRIEDSEFKIQGP